MNTEKMTDKELTVLCQVYRELNAIRARDGAAHGVCHKWWDELTESVDNIVLERTGKGAWLHPLLYKPEVITDNEVFDRKGRMLTVAILLNGNPLVAKNAIRQDGPADSEGYIKYKNDAGEIILHRPSDGAVVLAKRLLDTIRND